MAKRTAAPRRRGTALIVVLGALALLSLLAVTFATRVGTERATARNFLDAARARLAAQSGVEAALAHLQGLLDRGLLPDGPARTLPPTPLGSGTYVPGGDLYEVKIEDANARINVNDGLAWGNDHAVSRNLRRLLNLLGAQPTVAVPNLGDRILDGRPPTGYASHFDLLRALSYDSSALDRVRDLLTARSWSDPSVALPVPLSAEAARVSPVSPGRPVGDSGPVYRFGHQKNFRGEPVPGPLLAFDPRNPDPFHHAVWGRDSLNPQWIELVTRSPVNVNAARREVLVALLTDLEGVFLLERRRRALPPTPTGGSPCGSPGGAYGWTALRYTYDASGDEGDEAGLLYRTAPLPAEKLADEILACRESRPSPGVPGLDYAREPFGGPFRSWAQFNLFVDSLVRGGLIADPREDLFGDPERRLASQAAGDVLKANFNPNLHLNEINPNRTLFAHVDKTDLVVQSTEFCFTPMGIFEIRSEGRILGEDGRARARAAVVAEVRLYDAVRDTAQRDFMAGAFASRRGGPETNNNLALESGPEPDNGPAPLENGYEGYLQLSTIGGNLTGASLKPPGARWTTLSDPSFLPGARPTPPGGPHLGSVLHAHFQFDHAAHHHASRNLSTSPPLWDGFRLPQGAWQTVFGRRCCLNRNWEDRTESVPGPYSPADLGRSGHDYRIARSFAGTPPRVREVAPGDLRLDGAYAERHSAFGYWIDENVSFNFNEGTAAFWIKPGFFPEAAGKRRTLLSAGRYHAHAPDVLNPSPFGLFLTPASGDEALSPSYAGTPFRPVSLAFGLGFSTSTGYNWETFGGPEAHATHHAFVLGPTLNHEGHGPDNGDPRVGDDGRFNWLRAHEWTHVAVTWDNPRGRLPRPDSVQVYVNGRLLPGTVGVPHLYAGQGQPFRDTPRWTTHSLQAAIAGLSSPRWCKNTIRLGGEPSQLFDGGLFPGNFGADATFDEFYLWLDRSPAYSGGLWGAQTLWARGRYYRPRDADPDDARFTSRAFELASPHFREPAPAAPSPGALSPAPVPTPRARTRVLAIAWTEIAEDYDRAGPRLRPKVFDYSASPPQELRPEGDTVADLHAAVGEAWFGPLRNDGWSPVRASDGTPPVVDGPVRYAAKLKAGTDRGSGAVLLSSPVLDDVTIFFDRGGPEFLSWVNP
jgi:hypothetical protein